MTPQKAAALLPIFVAFAQGKTVQYQTRDGWMDVVNLPFVFNPEKYRVKPDPIVIKYRRFLFKFSDNSLAIGITNHDMNLDSYIETRDDFVRWIDHDWVTYEGEV